MGAMKEKMIEVMEHGYLYWEEVPRDLIVKLGIDGLTPASGPINGPPDDRQAPPPHSDAVEGRA